MQKVSKKNIIEEKELTIYSDVDELKKVEEFSKVLSKKASLAEEQTENMAIVLTELANNAIVHGNKFVAEKKIFFHATIQKNKLTVSVRDEGPGFDPSKLPNPTNPENLWKENGRGIFLVKNLVDEVEFKHTKKGMEIIITENRKKEN